MTEYWVSRKKWRCPYCDIVINDDVPSRLQHETGLRHKGAVERALKGHYKKSATERKEKNDAEREMKRIEAAARAAMEKDGSGSIPGYGAEAASAEASTSSLSKADSAGKPPPAWKPKDALAVYGSAAPEFAELSAAEQAFVEEQERKRNEGLAGEWSEIATTSETVPVPPIRPSNSAASTSASAQIPPSERELARRFKIRERQVAFGDDDDEDDHALDDINVKKRIKTSAGKMRADMEDKKKLKPEWKPIALGVGGEDFSEGEDQTDGPVDEHTPPGDELDEQQNGHPNGSASKGGVDEAPSSAAGGEEAVDAPPLVLTADAPEAVTVGAASELDAAPPASVASSAGMFKKRKGGANRSGKKIFV